MPIRQLTLTWNKLRQTRVTFWLSLFLAALLMLSACAPIATVPPEGGAQAHDPTPTPATSAPAEADVAALKASLAAEFPVRSDDSADGFDGSSLLPLQTAADQPRLWIAHTFGMRPFDPLAEHTLALYTHDGEWLELARLSLECPDYLWEEPVEQVPIGDTRIWLALHGGAGAHSGCFYLLAWDGQDLTISASNFNSSPGAGDVVDVDGDGQPEVILNYTEPYIFCYACGVRLFAADILRWDGEAWASVELAPLPAESDPELRDLNNRALDLALANLFPDALALIQQALALAPDNQIVYWNEQWIRLHAQSQLELAEQGGYPLLGYVFYGDYAAAVDEMRGVPPEQIFHFDTPLIIDTAAHGWTDELSFHLIHFAEDALALQPDLAPAYFLRGWGRFLADPSDPAVVADVETAAQIAPDDPLYQESIAYLQATSILPGPTATPPARGISPATEPSTVEPVRFERGATAAMIASDLRGAAARGYRLEIAGGQILYVTVPAGVSVELLSPANQPVPGSVEAGATQFSIPATGHYTVVLRGSQVADVLIYIPPRPAVGEPPQPASTERVRFSAGATGTTLDVTLRQAVAVGYVLNIAARQRLFATVEGNGSFMLLDPQGRLLTPIAGAWASDAEYWIPYTGDYTLVLQGSGPVTLTLEIPPR